MTSTMTWGEREQYGDAEVVDIRMSTGSRERNRHHRLPDPDATSTEEPQSKNYSVPDSADGGWNRGPVAESASSMTDAYNFTDITRQF